MMPSGLFRAMMHIRVPPSAAACARILGIPRRMLTSVAARSPKHLPHVVVLGCGWGGYRVLKDIDLRQNAVTVISPRDHFTCTPMLAPAAVGRLRTSHITEPLTSLTRRGINHVLATATGVDFAKKKVVCADKTGKGNHSFEIEYDQLTIAVGQRLNALGVPGVEEHCLSLREAEDASLIRNAIYQKFEQASSPSLTAHQAADILNFVVVGGGAAGIEFAAHLHDLVNESMPRQYPRIARHARITIIESEPSVLNDFDAALSAQAAARFRRRGLVVETGRKVKAVTAHSLHFDGGTHMPFGVAVWATGTAPQPLIDALDCTKSGSGRIITDCYLAIKGCQDAYAIGDCATVEGLDIPRLAQVAEQQGAYLAKEVFNKRGTAGYQPPRFAFENHGKMVYVGGYAALLNLAGDGAQNSSFWTWALWRAYHLSGLLSTRNRLGAIGDWMRAFFFGHTIGKDQQ